MTNEQKLFPIFQQLYNKFQQKEFVNGTVEIVGAKIENLNPTEPLLNFGVKKTNEEYCKKELAWYLSQDLNVYPQMQDVKIWTQVADKDGYINSNYGYLIFNKANYLQYGACLDALIKDKNTRQAIMIYIRPTIHYEWDVDGRHDFICCISNQFFIRNNKLISIVNFRSQDLIFGFFNDFYWKCWVYNKLFSNLQTSYPELQIGYIDWFVGSLHVYKRHYELLERIYTNKFI